MQIKITHQPLYNPYGFLKKIGRDHPELHIPSMSMALYNQIFLTEKVK